MGLTTLWLPAKYLTDKKIEVFLQGSQANFSDPGKSEVDDAEGCGDVEMESENSGHDIEVDTYDLRRAANAHPE